MKVVGLPVVGIHARDPARLLLFYRDFLGFPVVEELDLPDRGVHLWYLQVGEARLKIIANQVPPAAGNIRGGVHAATGIRYFTLPVEGLDAVLEGLVAAGGVEVRPVVALAGRRIAMLEDPEGNCFELTETDPL
jgi:predicted enzyme related to lactoylglutathione lyase